MLLGPIFEFESLQFGRQPRFIWLRVIIASLLLLLLCFNYLAISSSVPSVRESAQLAESFFAFYASLSLIALLFITPSITAGMISTERERRTIEYLFATDLSNTEIILPKLFIRLLLILKIILVGIPILAIFGLLGGIQIEKILISCILNFSTTLVLASACLCVSVFSSRARLAITQSYSLVFLFLLAPLILYGVARAAASYLPAISRFLDGAADLFLSINPVYVGYFQLANDAIAVDRNQLFWTMVFRHLLLTVTFILLAVATVRRIHLQQASITAKKPLFQKNKPSKTVSEKYPLIWKECYFQVNSNKRNIFLRIFYLLLAIGFVVFLIYFLVDLLGSSRADFTDNYLQVSIPLSAILFFGTLLLVTSRAANQITYEKEQQTWLTLVSTPLTAKEILFSKALGTIYSFRWLLALLFLLELPALFFSPLYLFILLIRLLIAALFLWFAATLGLSYSLRKKSSLRAMNWATGSLLFVGGGGYLICCCPFGSFFSMNEATAMVFLPSGLIPYLYSAPAYLFTLTDFQSDFFTFLISFVLGIIGYSIFAAVLFSKNVEFLDKFRFQQD